MKRKITAIIVAISLLFVSVPAEAASVMVRDEFLDTNPEPFVEKGRTFVPLRAIFEALGAEVTWIGKTKTVVAKVGDKKTTLENPKVVNGRTVVPLRYVSESLGSCVNWSQELKTAYVDSTQPDVYARLVYSPQSLQNPADWRISVYDWGDNARLIIEKYQNHDYEGLHFQPSYSLSLFQKDGNLWREQRGMGAFIIYDDYNGNWKGIGTPQTLLAAPSLDPEIRKLNYSTEPNLYGNNQRRDFLIDFVDTGLYMRLDKNMNPGIGSQPEPPLMHDGVANPPTGIFVPLTN